MIDNVANVEVVAVELTVLAIVTISDSVDSSSVSSIGVKVIEPLVWPAGMKMASLLAK